MKTLITKYLEGKLSLTEQTELFGWLQDKANKKEFDQLKTEWENKRMEEDISPEYLMGWANLQSKLLNDSELKQNRHIKFNQFFRYAAAFILLVSVPGLWYFLQKDDIETLTSYTTVSADNGQVTKVFLPDGSEVWLNYGSTIKYDDLYLKENRRVELEGEAFFKAAKNKNLPMIVSCSELNVKVLGTSFNVMSYNDKSENIQVTLEEGEVVLYNNSNPNEMKKLAPGEMATYSRVNKQIKINSVKTILFTSWKDGIINIYNLTLEELVAKLERRYNQKFEIDEAAKSLRYTFIIKNENLPQVLDLIRIINAVDPVQKNDVIYLKYNQKRAKEMSQVD
jgi:ferric-dicitrate binding protein FerR (iron transport regulator)